MDSYSFKNGGDKKHGLESKMDVMSLSSVMYLTVSKNFNQLTKHSATKILSKN